MKAFKPMHGTAKVSKKGCSHVRLGNFCKMFAELPSWAASYAGCRGEAAVEQCEAEQVAAVLGGANGLMHDAGGGSGDSGIPAAYTFFAQFVDHDITLDTESMLHGEALDEVEVRELPNLRSASLDLDCVYGLGPEAMPFMYDQSQPGRMLTGNEVNDNDLPRNQDGRAMIGDPRNDENMFVAQMQLLFIRFHNRRIVGRTFDAAQQDCRFHYQWLVLHDLLQRVCDQDVYQYALGEITSGNFPKTDFKDKCGNICMPVEFSAAAYRFGHTLVRSQYPANADYPVIDLFDERFGTEGFSALPPELTVDWRLLLDVDDCQDYVLSKAVDHLLADELIRMPDPVVGRFASDNDRSLAFRNILRGYVMGLASGQSVAKALQAEGYPLDPAQDLKFSDIDGWHCLDESTADCLGRETPLFFYLMREAAVIGSGERLGPVGSAILMEVFGSMLLAEGCDSFLMHKDWCPDACLGGKDFTLAHLVRYVNSANMK